MDEVELANPLGSKREGKHKVSVFYWVLLNLPPQFRSSLRSIQLLGIVSCDLLKQRGSDVFLRSFIEDLIRFENGVTLTVRNEKKKWFGVLLNFAGDMPAYNFVGGFKEWVGFAKSPCRTCTIHRDNLETIHCEIDCILRDKLSHEKQVLELEIVDQTQAARDALSCQYGVNRRCPFSVLRYFYATKCFMHDLMHIFYEGTLNLETALLLRVLIPDDSYIIATVNYNISTLKSGREFTSPPPFRKSEILDSKKLSFSSSEMSSVAMCLAIVLGEFVSSENPYFANFLLLLEIMTSLQSYSFTEKQLAVLQKNIEIHNKNHVFLYPKPTDSAGKAIFSKLHTLIHFPSQIKQFGPPASRGVSVMSQRTPRLRKLCEGIVTSITSLGR
ncbi:uncharacterized protein LOC123475769 isoform X1 [Daphnia magna]|uniref:uncharacterized protein LOC123475769 isoform X1 n=1 Tax=Daphnia magna TaxID=35525 RepID=UPI001E1BA036|nr:uncharacterized protein LOC123475769 isoform X1 [Daphnia magna]XP_045034736.1 uncharacterized protein LOC123475769 isoform X1 [Daphnia magna]